VTVSLHRFGYLLEHQYSGDASTERVANSAVPWPGVCRQPAGQ